MSNLAESYRHLDSKIEIHYDDDKQSPREFGDEPTQMVCWHRNYCLGDEPEFGGGKAGSPDLSTLEYLTQMATVYDEKLADFIDRMENQECPLPFAHWGTPEYAAQQATRDAWHAKQQARIWKRVQAVLDDNYVIRKLYLYDHSGISMSCSSFIGRAQHAAWDSGPVGYIYTDRKTMLKEWGDPKRPGQLTKKVREAADKYLEGDVETYNQYLTGDVYGYVVKRKGEEVDSCWGFYGLEYVKKEAESVANWSHKIRTEKAYHERGYDSVTGKWLRPGKAKCERLYHTMQQALK